MEGLVFERPVTGIKKKCFKTSCSSADQIHSPFIGF